MATAALHSDDLDRLNAELAAIPTLREVFPRLYPDPTDLLEERVGEVTDLVRGAAGRPADLVQLAREMNGGDPDLAQLVRARLLVRALGIGDDQQIDMVGVQSRVRLALDLPAGSDVIPADLGYLADLAVGAVAAGGIARTPDVIEAAPRRRRLAEVERLTGDFVQLFRDAVTTLREAGRDEDADRAEQRWNDAGDRLEELRQTAGTRTDLLGEHQIHMRRLLYVQEEMRTITWRAQQDAGVAEPVELLPLGHPMMVAFNVSSLVVSTSREGTDMAAANLVRARLGIAGDIPARLPELVRQAREFYLGPDEHHRLVVEAAVANTFHVGVSTGRTVADPPTRADLERYRAADSGWTAAGHAQPSRMQILWSVRHAIAREVADRANTMREQL